MSFRRYSVIGFVLSGICALSGAACSSEAPDGHDSEEVDSAERWNSSNNPAYVDSTFVYEVDALPLSGGPKTAPIPGYYWPTAHDSVNSRWDGKDTLSPAEKYGAAFGIADVGLAVSKDTGIRGQTNRKECTVANDCAEQKDGSICAIPTGETKGRCIPLWWGVCHGWAPYAISQPQFQQPVTKNGVTFYAADIEALMSLAYGRGLPTKFIGERCNRDHNSESPVAVEFDTLGRSSNSECRDINAGAFHVVISNLLGMRSQALVYDRTFDDEVWNQPVRDFEVTNAVDNKLKQITKAEAVKLLGLDIEIVSLQKEREYKKDESQTGVYAALEDGDITFRLTGSGNADLYVRRGAAASKTEKDCASTRWGSEEECKLTVKKGDLVHYLIANYEQYLTTPAKAALTVAKPKVGDVAYSYNTTASRFYEVEVDFRYIREPRASRQASSPDAYTATDHYHYILEADADGRIQGGEWVGDSRTGHPDFLWWPTGNPTGSVAQGKITFANVLELSNSAAQAPAPVATVTTLIDKKRLSAYSTYATVGLKTGETLTLEMTGTGNADLYVRKGYKPTTARFDCKSTGATSTETCTVKAPAGGATYYVRARPMASGSEVTVVASITK